MCAHANDAVPFQVKIEKVREDSEHKEQLLRNVIEEIRSAFTAGALSSADFDSLTGRALLRMEQFGL